MYGNEPTKVVADRLYGPQECRLVAMAILNFVNDPQFFDQAGRKELRKILATSLGPPHERFQGIGPYKLPVWRYVLDGGEVQPAPDGYNAAGLPTVYLIGSTARNFSTLEMTATTNGTDAAAILEYIASRLGLKHTHAQE